MECAVGRLAPRALRAGQPLTLGVNVVLCGFMVMLTGGFSPSSQPTPIMLYLAKGDLFGVPIPVFIWAALGVAVIFMLRRTPMGRYVYAIGNRQAAVASFALCRCSPRSRDCHRRLFLKNLPGDGRQLSPAFDRGGGHRRRQHSRRLGSVFRRGGRHDSHRAIASVLSVMQMPEAARQMIYGVVIIAMLLAYGRSAAP